MEEEEADTQGAEAKEGVRGQPAHARKNSQTYSMVRGRGAGLQERALGCSESSKDMGSTDCSKDIGSADCSKDIGWAPGDFGISHRVWCDALLRGGVWADVAACHTQVVALVFQVRVCVWVCLCMCGCL